MTESAIKSIEAEDELAPSSNNPVDDEEIERASEATEDAQDSWIDLLGSGDLFRKIIAKGDLQLGRPQNNDVVTVKLIGTLEDAGNTIDENASLRFQLGQYETIPALELCVQAMNVGETDLIKTSARFAYGSAGRKDDVPPDSSILYEVSLLSVEKAPDVTALPQTDRLDLCEKKKNRGNYFFQRKEFDQAIEVYKRAISILDVDLDNDYESLSQENIDRIHRLASDIYNNLGAAQLKIESWSEAMASFGSCLERSPDNVKALFRMGKAHVGLGDYETALNHLRRAVEIDPESLLIQKELNFVQTKVMKNKRVEQEMYSRMFRSKPSNKLESLKKNWHIPLKVIGASLISTCIAVGVYYCFF